MPNATSAPKTSAAAVKEKTGKDWNAWFRVLDKAKAQTLTHREIVKLLAQHDLPSWWCQMITVEYERARGLREAHQKSDGYSVSASKTVAVSIDAVFAATATAAARKKWFPSGTFKASSTTENKYLNGRWNSARLNIGFFAKAANKSQIAIQVSQLASKKDVEAERARWKQALGKLAAALDQAN